MNDELKEIDEQIQRELVLKKYKGDDLVIHAEIKKEEIEEERHSIPDFKATSDFPSLENCTEGFRKGQLVILSGPPKNGKTALCQTLTKQFVRGGARCLWFSYELGYRELFKKFPMDNLDFYVPNYMKSGNLEWIEQRIIESKVKYNTDIVFIDHLDFLRDPDVIKGISSNYSIYIGGIIQQLKFMAVQHDIVVFLMTHIRKSKWDSNQIPSSEELADSRQIAQLADIVLMIIRKRLKNNEEMIHDGNKAILGVVENRHNGRTKKFALILKDNEFFEYEERNGSNLSTVEEDVF